MKRIVAREDVCIGCRLCEVHCLGAHSRSRDLVKAFKKEAPRAVARVRVEEQGVVSFASICHHCHEPICVYSCLTGALQKDPVTGVVTVDESRCMGCWTCVLVCPNGAIVPDFSRGKVAKCDLCAQRESPACVANCPNQALSLQEEKAPAN